MYSVEYSKNQKCLHVDELQRALKVNKEKFLLNKDNDWEIIGVFETMEEADKFSDEMWNKVIIPRYYAKAEVV